MFNENVSVDEVDLCKLKPDYVAKRTYLDVYINEEPFMPLQEKKRANFTTIDDIANGW